MRRLLVNCGLCGTTVRLTKGGRVPEHLTQGYYACGLRRCNGVQRGIEVAPAAAIVSWQQRWQRAGRLKRLRYHRAGKAMVNDPTQHNRLAGYRGWNRLMDQRR